MSRSFEYDVFLSHKSADKAAVETIAAKLKSAGIEPWFDKWHLIPGAPWQKGLAEGIGKSETVAVFVGPSGIGPWEDAETMSALDRAVKDNSRRVIPVLLPGAPDNPEMPEFLRLFTWVDFRKSLDDEEAFPWLVAGILGQPPTSVRPPTKRGPRYTRPPWLRWVVHAKSFVSPSTAYERTGFDFITLSIVGWSALLLLGAWMAYDHGLPLVWIVVLVFTAFMEGGFMYKTLPRPGSATNRGSYSRRMAALLFFVVCLAAIGAAGKAALDEYRIPAPDEPKRLLEFEVSRPKDFPRTLGWDFAVTVDKKNLKEPSLPSELTVRIFLAGEARKNYVLEKLSVLDSKGVALGEDEATQTTLPREIRDAEKELTIVSIPPDGSYRVTVKIRPRENKSDVDKAMEKPQAMRLVKVAASPHPK